MRAGKDMKMRGWLVSAGTGARHHQARGKCGLNQSHTTLPPTTAAGAVKDATGLEASDPAGSCPQKSDSASKS